MECVRCIFSTRDYISKELYEITRKCMFGYCLKCQMISMDICLAIGAYHHNVMKTENTCAVTLMTEKDEQEVFKTVCCDSLQCCVVMWTALFPISNHLR